MTLRARLLVGLAAIFVVFAAAGVFIVAAQRSNLYAQLDEQLESIPLPPDFRGPERKDEQPRPEVRVPPETDATLSAIPEAPLSTLFLAALRANGELNVLIEGQLLTDSPSQNSLATLADSEAGLPEARSNFDVAGEQGVNRFRVLYVPPLPGGAAAIVAVPLDGLETTVNQLIFAFVGLALVVAVVLALIGYWVNRFGLRPIASMTGTAEAIAAGDRDSRVDGVDDSTESGRLAGALNVMLDERDEAENRLRQFVSDASHELRTPLTSIRGYLDLYDEGAFRAEGELDDVVRRMKTESERMGLLVEDLLLLAKLDEHQPLELEAVDPLTLLDDIATSARAANPGREIELVAPTGSPPAVVADRLRLHQALAGLVDNAVTHTPNDSRIRLSVAPVEDGVRIEVADNGPGLPAEELEAVFDRFYRGDRSRSRVSGGSGLGLSITRSIVEAHGGRITATSTAGSGATFVVVLPTSR